MLSLHAEDSLSISIVISLLMQLGSTEMLFNLQMWHFGYYVECQGCARKGVAGGVPAFHITISQNSVSSRCIKKLICIAHDTNQSDRKMSKFVRQRCDLKKLLCTK